jgi:hypothetical protein
MDGFSSTLYTRFVTKSETMKNFPSSEIVGLVEKRLNPKPGNVPTTISG